MICTHYECRCARAYDLTEMGRTEEAVQLHQLKTPVECRLYELEAEARAIVRMGNHLRRILPEEETEPLRDIVHAARAFIDRKKTAENPPPKSDPETPEK